MKNDKSFGDTFKKFAASIAAVTAMSGAVKAAEVQTAPLAPKQDVHIVKPAEVHAAKVQPAEQVHIRTPAAVHAVKPKPVGEIKLKPIQPVHRAKLTDFKM